MQLPMLSEIEKDQLDAAVEEVFEAMLGMVCRPEPASADTGRGIVASVAFAGPLEGECRLRLTREAALAVTAELMGVTDEALAFDTVGELCNMIAGSWKSRLPGAESACALSVPCVWLDADDGDASQRSYRFRDYSLQLGMRLYRRHKVPAEMERGGQTESPCSEPAPSASHALTF